MLTFGNRIGIRAIAHVVLPDSAVGAGESDSLPTIDGGGWACARVSIACSSLSPDGGWI
jgi:hypothetical protein